MWQLYAIMALSMVCVENTIDKIAVKEDIDSGLASFIRIAIYSLVAPLIIMAFGYKIEFYVSTAIVLFGLGGAVTAVFYIEGMKRVKASSLAVLTCLGPLLFLAVDHYLENAIGLSQSLTVVFLVIGGTIFVSVDKFEINKETVAAFLFMTVFFGGEAYLVKYYQNNNILDGYSTIINLWLWSVLFLGIYSYRKLKDLFAARSVKYMKYCIVSKTFDSLNTVFAIAGLAMTNVSQYSAMEVFFPPLMFVTVLVTQYILKIDIGEELDFSSAYRKLTGLFVIVLSACFTI